MSKNDPHHKKVSLPLHLRKAFPSAEGVAHLFEAITFGRTGTVAIIFDKNPDAAGWRHNSHTPLTHACIGQKNADVVELLLARGCAPDEKDGNGWTPLTTAAFHNRAEKIIILLEAGADIDGKDGHGNTPLLRAVKAGHAECVDLLVVCGAKRDVQNNFGETIDSILLKNKDEKTGDVIREATARLEDARNSATGPKDIPVFKKPIQVKNRNKGLKQ